MLFPPPPPLLRTPLTILLFLIATAGLYLYVRPPASPSPPRAPLNDAPPISIPALISAAQSAWSKTQQTPPPTLAEATRSYTARNRLPPPPGFSIWYTYARSVNSTLLLHEPPATFDPAMTSLLPLLRLGPHVTRRRAESLLRQPYDIGGVTFGPHGARWERADGASESHYFRTRGVVEMLQPVQDLLKEALKDAPEFTVPVNELAEARVLGLGGPATGSGGWRSHESGDRSLLNDIAAACSSHQVRDAVFEVGIDEMELLKGSSSSSAWVRDDLTESDICDPQLVARHGVYRGHAATTDGLVPVLSYGRPSAFADIPIPSKFQYAMGGDYEYSPEADTSWERKEKRLYWRGEPSGGGHGDKFYGSMHRHRFVKLANTFPQDWVNVSFTKIEPCEIFGCDLKKHFTFLPRADFQDAWHNTLVFDSDGWGPSARFRGLMLSGSAAVRSSVYREWFTGSAVPWVHYIPISVGLEELRGVTEYFLGPGDAQARKIAKQGKTFAEMHMRNQDMTAYLFRLVLELNRVFNGDELD